MTVEGFQVDARTRAGIRAVLCEHVTIRGNRLDANGKWGILTGHCDDLLIEGNVASNSLVEHGIYVSNSGDRPVIRGNVVFGNFANGIHMNGDIGEGGDGIISDALVENNVLWDNGDGDGSPNSGGGSGINCDGVRDSVIRNNLIFDTHASGISLYRIDGGGASTGNQVLHNTVLVADDGRWALNIRDASTGNTARNNVFYSAHSYRGAMSVDADSLSGFSSDRNAVEDRFTTDDGDSVLTLAQWQGASGQDGTSLVVTAAGLDELFVDLAGGDYHPAPEGALTDAGLALAAVLADLEGTPRPQGPGHDIGAYEGPGFLFRDGFEGGDLGAWSRSEP
jgi:parallel beta-helix repeat protein